jgi:hypothetical protein
LFDVWLIEAARPSPLLALAPPTHPKFLAADRAYAPSQILCEIPKRCRRQKGFSQTGPHYLRAKPSRKLCEKYFGRNHSQNAALGKGTNNCFMNSPKSGFK